MLKERILSTSQSQPAKQEKAYEAIPIEQQILKAGKRKYHFVTSRTKHAPKAEGQIPNSNN